MAIKFRATMPTEHPSPQRQAAVLATQGSCARCGGLMVEEFCMDLMKVQRVPDYTAQRCVQCGQIVDRVILQNRMRQQGSDASSEQVRGKSSEVAGRVAA